MLPFFRKIRYRLAKDNQFFKYSRYAIGEIVLVVIGILIALQINNWNERQKMRILERETLLEILENITEIETDLIEAIERVKLQNKFTDTILSLIETKSRDPELFGRSLHRAVLDPFTNIQIKKVGYETLKNRGVDIIRNKEVKNSILHLYEDSLSAMMLSFNWSIWEHKTDYLLKHFSPSSGGDRIIYAPYNYELVISDTYFKSMILTTKVQRDFFHGVMSSTLEDTQKTKGIVNEELNK